jgi:Ni/Fe-hydrogenase subunit HybB-like protein
MLFEVSWCGMLYSTVLTLEFSPALVEKIPWKGVRAWYLKQQHRILIGLVLVGCVLSSLHQSFLGGLYVLTKGKLDPLWYTPYLTTLFYLSAIPAGLAVTLMALYLCVRSLNVKLDTRILSELSRVIAPMLALYGIFRAVDLTTHGALPYMFRWREETLSFWVEVALFVITPLVLLSREKVQNSPQFLYWTCSLIVMGFMANRLNVSITGLQASAGVYYVPKWTEFASTLMVLTAVVLAFRYAVIYLDILPKNATQKWMVKESAA